MQVLTRDQELAMQSAKLKQLQAEQVAAVSGGKELETVDANRAPGKKILAIESEDYVHVETLVKHINPDNKGFTNEVTMHKIYAREFDRRVAEGYFRVFDEAEVIHDPRGADQVYNLKAEEKSAANTAVPAANVALKERELKAKQDKLDQALADVEALKAAAQKALEDAQAAAKAATSEQAPANTGTKKVTREN